MFLFISTFAYNICTDRLSKKNQQIVNPLQIIEAKQADDTQNSAVASQFSRPRYLSKYHIRPN
jgi:hypothetical protein